jgi:hypothetical protein
MSKSEKTATSTKQKTASRRGLISKTNKPPTSSIIIAEGYTAWHSALKGVMDIPSPTTPMAV